MGFTYENREKARENTDPRSIVLCFDGTNNEYGEKVNSPSPAYVNTV